MKTIIIKVTDDNARIIHSYLCALYNKKKSTELNALCKIAVWREVLTQVKKDLKKPGIENEYL